MVLVPTGWLRDLSDNMGLFRPFGKRFIFYFLWGITTSSSHWCPNFVLMLLILLTAMVLQALLSWMWQESLWLRMSLLPWSIWLLGHFCLRAIWMVQPFWINFAVVGVMLAVIISVNTFSFLAAILFFFGRAKFASTVFSTNLSPSQSWLL